MSSDPSAPLPTPTNYQRTGGGHLRWQPPTPEHLQEMLPAYEVLSILGQGGMGAVYKGRQKSLDRIVAIKILPPEAGEDDMQFVERFKNEARTMAKMNHPAIVHVYDFGETTEGQLYIVMEFIDGTDVAKMIQSQGKLPEDYALSITAHVCDALGYAHTQGVVHRDIKPANVLINMDGQVKVADFGLAKATDPSQMGLTKTNMAMGTPDFVSPEALMPGVPLDGRADLYAVGVMLFNMLTGTIPRGAFRMPSATLQTDARFDKIIGKAMEMDRENRYQTALDLRRDLDVILTTPAAKTGMQTIPAQAAQPQKPMGKSPSAPQGKEGSAGTPARSVPTADKSVRAPAAPAKKSNAVMIYGIAAAVVVAGVAFMFSGGGKKPVPAPKAVAESKPEPKKPDSKPAAPPTAASKSKPTESKPAPAPSTVASGNEKWVDGLAQWFGTQSSKLIVREPSGAARIESYANITPILPSAPAFGDQVARMRWHPLNAKAVIALQLRHTVDASGKRTNYSAGIRPSKEGGWGVRLAGPAGVSQPLGNRDWALPTNFDFNATHTMEFRIVGDLFTATVDGKKITEVRDSQLTTGHPLISAENMVIESFEYANLDPTESKPTPAPAAVVAGNEKWVDGLAQWFGGTQTNKAFVRESNGSAHIGTGAASLQPVPSSAPGFCDQVVRMRWHGINLTAGTQLYVRLTKDTSGKEMSYRAGVKPAKETGWEVRLSGPSGVLGNRDWALPSDFKIDAPHTMELRVVGELLTATVDGKKIAEVRDSQVTAAGRPAFSGHDVIIESFEYANLDPGGSAPAAPVTTKGKVGDILTFAGHRYQFHTGPFIKDEARDLAANLGGHLVTITSAAEQAWIEATFADLIGGPKKKGLCRTAGDLAGSGSEKWTNGEPWGYTNWDEGHPKGKTDPSVLLFQNGSKCPWRAGYWSQSTSAIIEWDSDESAKPVPVVNAVPAPSPAPAMPAVTPVPASAAPAAPVDPRLAQLAAGFKARLESDAVQPFNTALTTLNTSYVANGVSRARAAAKAKGSLVEVTALDAEKTSIEQGRGVPAEDDSDTADSLKTLRATYRSAHAKFTAERDAKAAPLYDLYLKALDAYIAELTQTDKIDTARKVQVFRDDIALQKPAAGAAVIPPAVKSTTSAPAPSAAAKPAARAPKMNERELAEWAIATGGFVDVLVGTPPVYQKIAIASELPRGRFLITLLDIKCEKVPGKDLSPLASAQDAARVQFSNILLADNTSIDLSPLRQMPKLRTLATRDLDAAAVDVIASLDVLDTLYAGNIPEGSLEKIAKLKQLVTFNSTAISGPGIAALKSCKLLRNIQTGGNSDDDVRALAAALPDLEKLDISGPELSNACIPFLLSLKSLKHLSLQSNELDDLVVEPLAKLPNLSQLRLNCRKIVGSNLNVLKKFSSLRDLYLDGCSITDEALDVLVQIKGLTKLQLRDTKVTDAGIAKFKAARPGFNISK